MPLTVESGAALIPGAALSKAKRQVRVLRPVSLGHEQVAEVGDTLHVPAPFAAELVAANKAEYLPDAPAPAPAAEPAPAPTKTTPAKPAKESPHAR